MATTDEGSSADASSPSDAATTLRDASFVHVVALADGDAVAASGLLARALADRGTPYQVSLASTAEEARRRLTAGDERAARVAVGVDAAAATVTLAGVGASTPAAVAVGRELEATPDPALALAGTVAAGGDPDDVEATDAAFDRRPGVAVPTADLADGLAHSTLVHARFSGDVDAAGALLAELDLPVELAEEDRRRIASAVALDALTDDAAGERAAEAVARALRPTAPGGPFETVGGYADVLDVTADARPGIALALALGYDVRTAALDAWRDAAVDAHRAVRTADTRRLDGLLVVDVEEGAPLRTVARVVAAFRSPEPATLVLAPGEAVLAGDPDRGCAAVLADAVDAVGGSAAGTEDRAYARQEADDGDAFVAAVREAL